VWREIDELTMSEEEAGVDDVAVEGQCPAEPGCHCCCHVTVAVGTR